jgi:serine/threonine protein kinase
MRDKLSAQSLTHHRTLVMQRRSGTFRAAGQADGIRPGSWLGAYRVCLALASGGMARVYLARMEGRAGAHRFVALKCLKHELASDERFVEMFFDEAEIATQINHPNVCHVIDFDEHHGVKYLAMEYLAGETLSAVHRQLAAQLDEWPPAVHAALVSRIIADASEGLHAAHQLVDSDGQPVKVVHRDISPENLMLTYDGGVKVLDFGVSLSGQQRHKTRTGVLKGKYCYVQPEVLQGNKPDQRSDIWSLGVVLWELLTAKALFDRETDVETLRAVSEAEIPPPSTLREGLPVTLDPIVLRALQRDPARRYQSARELGRQLMRFLAEERLATGLADLAEAMERWFPSGRACQQKLLQTVARMDEETGSLLPVVCEEGECGEDQPSAVSAPASSQADRDRRSGASVVEVVEARGWARSWPTWRAPLLATACGGGVLLMGAWYQLSSPASLAPAEPKGVEQVAAAPPQVAAAPPQVPTEPPAQQIASESAPSGAVAGADLTLDVQPVEATADEVILRVRLVSSTSPAPATVAPQAIPAQAVKRRAGPPALLANPPALRMSR